MAYGGGCIIGAQIITTDKRYQNGWELLPTTEADAATYDRLEPTWPQYDGAWTPKDSGTAAYSSGPAGWWATLANDVAGSRHAFLVATPYTAQGGVNPSQMGIAWAQAGSYGSGSGRKYLYFRKSGSTSIGTSIRVDPDVGYSRWIIFDELSTNATSFCLDVIDRTPAASEHLIRVSEFTLLSYAEMTENQELVSYRRTRTAPSAVEIKTMDGAVRKYVTGSASTAISATWRWSDNGAIASKLDNILRYAQDSGSPLVVYVPSGIYYNGPFLDIVRATNEPTVTMPAPGIYELTIEGTCQP